MTSEQLRVLHGNGDFELVTKAIAGIGLMSLNQKIEKLTNPKLWQAIKWAVDYQGIQKNIVPLTHKVHQTIIPEGFPGAVNETPFQKDLEKAKGLMQEAGLADGFTIKMDHYSAQPWPDIAQAIQANLAEIGIKVELLAAENRQVLTKMRAREHEIALTAWGSDYFDPNTNADVFCNNPDNSDNAATKPFARRSSYQNEEFAKKSIAARDERDSAKRIELYENLQREFMNDSPFIVMLQTVTTAACRKDITGMRLGVLSDSHSYAGDRQGVKKSLKNLTGILSSVLITLFGLMVITFMIGRVMPVDPVIAAVGDNAPEAVIQRVRAEMGLDQPLVIQFVHYVGQVLHGDFGTSILTRNPVTQDIARYFPATLNWQRLRFLLLLLSVFRWGCGLLSGRVPSSTRRSA